jgi:hypothetical protein
MFDSELPRLAEELQQKGINAKVESPAIDRSPQAGLLVDGSSFYPLWELNQDGNEELARAGKFEAIEKKRPPNWTPAVRYT